MLLEFIKKSVSVSYSALYVLLCLAKMLVRVIYIVSLERKQDHRGAFSQDGVLGIVSPNL